jgi:hypothetical protein
MKKFFKGNSIKSIRSEIKKGFEGISEIFALGADTALISCMSGDNFQIFAPGKITEDESLEKQITLNEIFTKFNDKKFILEIYGKADKSGELAEIIKKNSMEDKVLIWAEDPGVMKKIRAKIPEIATAMTTKEFINLYFLFKTGFLYFKKNFKADCIISIESIGISYILNQSMINELTARKIFAIALVDSAEVQVKRLIDSGCSGFVFKDADNFKKVKKLLQI